MDKSYFTGCSGGGRQALKQMQNYPGDYDGVIAGAPGPYMPLQSVRMLWFALQQKWTPAGALSDTDWALYESKATAACDSQDGVKDGVISNPLACKFKTATLLCKPGQTEGCLTAPKLKMLDLIRAPMRDEAGRAMDGGLFAGVRTRPGPPSPLLRAMWADGVYDDANWNEDSFQRSRDLLAANRKMPELRADKVAIAPFIKTGGKAILYQGWADPSTNAGPTIDYYAALARANGGLERLDDSVRLFMAPGMYHCARGPGADQLGASGHSSWPGDPSRDVLWSLIHWVEKGQAPERLTATKLVEGKEAFTRTLCPYPQAARWDGKGPVEAASSYRCVVDPALVKYMGRKTLVGS
ncbi:tannase/feruloyl esterase family alpha/beta hydrolase [Sphingomonas sp. J315]|uniref:tannase/feruloyl esterase family alpha/beta hydrolase n=1 Tax=Sphingomonas sp. J315 TaxID=2898433 RepID=UPI0021AD996C|nr:tannase/feruloyl esterase family alpha/beta hydrolase [Sphingomonas sp. J315]